MIDLRVYQDHLDHIEGLDLDVASAPAAAVFDPCGCLGGAAGAVAADGVTRRDSDDGEVV